MRLFPLVLLFLLATASADDGLPPPPPVLSPSEQLKTFRFAEPGYRIELVASDPMIQDPVAMTFDGDGRLWVVEMRGYMQDIDRSGVHDPIGRVSVLKDRDGDGLMDASTVFSDNLILPRAISVHPDGVLIAENEPLHFYEDTDGDLVADRKTLVDPNYARDSIEHSANGLFRALDNWIYNAKEGHRYRRSGTEWIREETEDRGQWGISQDDRGRLFYNYNHSQLFTDFAPPNALTRNPNHEPSTGLSVGVTMTNAVFPIRPTLAANRGYIPGALDEEGRIQEFTSACSPLIYRSGLFPEFSGNAFVCSTVGNLIKRNVLSDSGLRVTGTQAYPDRDFLASTDERFRPCWLSEGPDGAIYIVDMYRGIVQDGPHMSPYLREHIIAREMDQPVHLGRIWRIVPEEFTQSETPTFSAWSGEKLVELLAHPSGWWRDQAQRHLVDRDLSSTIPALRQLALTHEQPLVRLHALWTLEGLADSEPEQLLSSLDDASPMVQAAALRVLYALGLSHERLAKRIAERCQTTVPEEVALQMILTLGDLKIADATRIALIEDLLLPRVHDPLFRDAALSSLNQREDILLRSVLAGVKKANAANPSVAFLLESLSQSIIQSRQVDAIEALLSHLKDPPADWVEQALLAGIRVHASALTQKPIELTSAPAARQAHPQFQHYFAWPGHVPEPPKTTAVRPLKPKEQTWFARGRQVYLASCVACHGNDGMGTRLLAPPLAGSDWVLGTEERLVRVLFHGLAGPITVSGKRYATPEVQPVMPPLATLSNDDISAVLTYIRREWGNTADPISPGDINQHRINAQGRTVPWTEEELAPYAQIDHP